MERDEAIAFIDFAELRWAETKGNPVCPRCGDTNAYPHWSRCTFKCKACEAHFSLTTRTIFASTKLPIGTIMDIIEAKELSPIKLCRKVPITYKTAWVLCAKMKEAIEKHGGIFNAPVSREFKGYWQRNEKLS